MAFILPVDTAIPDLLAETWLRPGLGHWDDDQGVGELAEGQHFLMAYGGKTHCVQRWRGRVDGLAAGECEELGAVLVAKRRYLVRPRLAMLGLRFRFRAESAHGGTVRFDCLDTATGVSAAIAAGPGLTYSSAALAIGRENLITRIEVSLLATAGATPFAGLLGLAIYDADLSAAQLPGI
jgi:hypothetical protein